MSTKHSPFRALANNLLDSVLQIDHTQVAKQRSVVITLEPKFKATMYYRSDIPMHPMLDTTLKLAAFSIAYQHGEKIAPLWEDEALAYRVRRYFGDKAVQIQNDIHASNELDTVLTFSNNISDIVMKYELGNASLTLKVNYKQRSKEEIEKYYKNYNPSTMSKETVKDIVDVSAIDAVDPALAELMRGLCDATKH